MNSAQPDYYAKYYRMNGYTFSDVTDSIRVMKGMGRFVSLNYFIFPGFTDSHLETEALCTLLEQTGPDFIQLRNLNMDPEWYMQTLELQPDLKTHGIRNWLSLMKKRFPKLRFGYFNPPVNA